MSSTYNSSRMFLQHVTVSRSTFRASLPIPFIGRLYMRTNSIVKLYSKGNLHSCVKHMIIYSLQIPSINRLWDHSLLKLTTAQKGTFYMLSITIGTRWCNFTCLHGNILMTNPGEQGLEQSKNGYNVIHISQYKVQGLKHGYYTA